MAFLWRTWRGSGELPPAPPAPPADLASSTESLRRAAERSSGRSARSASAGYLAMSALKDDPERPRRPPKPRPAPPACEYVDVEPRPPSRRPRPDRLDTDPPLQPRCREYELMADFMSHARSPPPPCEEEERAPAVPPRARPAPAPRPPSATDAVSTDDSLLDELQRDTYCVLKVCEDESPDESEPPPPPSPSPDEEPFSRLSLHRKSNPTKGFALPAAGKALKASSSTSNVHESAAPRPLAERLTPFFLKRKPKQPEAEGAPPRADNLIGRLTPRFGQSRLNGRGRSLELASSEPPRRIERSQTAVNIQPRALNSSFNLKFLSLHRYGASPPAPPAPPADTATNDIRL